jgi:hypothetical protein
MRATAPLDIMEQIVNIVLSQQDVAPIRNECGSQGFRHQNKGRTHMLAALATLTFLAAIWLAVVAAAATLGANRTKILAALRGQSLLCERRSTPVPVRVTQRSRLQRPLRARPEWRAAA